MRYKYTKAIIFIFVTCYSNCINQWRYTFCKDSICLYFNGTIYGQLTSDGANSVCTNNGLQLLEIPNQKMQDIVDAATATWDDYSMGDYYFRINLVEVVSDWTWINTGQPFDDKHSLYSYPYFETIFVNSSGVFYKTELENSLHYSICSYKGSCIASDNSLMISDTDSSSCILVRKTTSDWFNSRRSCQVVGGDLVTITSSSRWVSRIPQGSYWIGLTKAAYVWKSSNMWSNYFRWKDGEPQEGRDCTYITHENGGQNYWAKAPCIGLFPFICTNGTENVTDSILTFPQLTMDGGKTTTLSIVFVLSSATTRIANTSLSFSTSSSFPGYFDAAEIKIGIIVLGTVLLVAFLVGISFLLYKKCCRKSNKLETEYNNKIYEREIKTCELENSHDLNYTTRQTSTYDVIADESSPDTEITYYEVISVKEDASNQQEDDAYLEVPEYSKELINHIDAKRLTATC